MKHTEKSVQDRLAHWLQPSLFIVPNAPMGPGQADILRYMPSRRIEEYEIKLSRSDFFRDFKTKTPKHFGLKGENVYWERPNKFFYVYPRGMLTLSEIPEYAGAVEFSENLCFEVARKAPLLHSGKCSLKRLAYLIRGLSLRYWNKRLFGVEDEEREG